MADISTTYLGLKLKSPIIAASSGLTNSLEDLKKIEAAGAGAVVLKSLFEEEIVTEVSGSITTGCLPILDISYYFPLVNKRNIKPRHLHLMYVLLYQSSLP